MSALVPSTFDYSALDRELAEEARSFAKLIIDEESRARESATGSIVKIGEWLTVMKEKLGHGQFMAWVEAEFRWKQRTAQRYMAVAAEFGANTTLVSHLPPSTVYALAAPSTPAPVREQIIQKLEAQEQVDPLEVRHLIKEAKQADLKSRRVERMKPAERRNHRRSENNKVRQEEEWRERQRARSEAAYAAAAFLRAKLGPDIQEFIDLIREVDLVEFRTALVAPPASSAMQAA